MVMTFPNKLTDDGWKWLMKVPQIKLFVAYGVPMRFIGIRGYVLRAKKIEITNSRETSRKEVVAVEKVPQKVFIPEMS